MERQWSTGLRADDLSAWQGQLPRPGVHGQALSVRGAIHWTESTGHGLSGLIGSVRIVGLYTQLQPEARGVQAELRELVAVRILQVTEADDGGLTVTVQPAVLATRTACVAAAAASADVSPNRYLYRLSLTH
jgi:hypothetical protein